MWSKILRAPYDVLSIARTMTCLAAFAALGCSGLAGKHRDGIYVSPAGNFTLALASSSAGPTAIRDSYDEATRSGTLYVDYVNYEDIGASEGLSYKYHSREEIERAQALSTDEFNAFHTKRFSEFLRGQGNVVVEMEPTFIATDHRDMLFAIYRVPGGSRIWARDNFRFLDRRVGAGRQLDALVGMLIFLRGNFSYYLNVETPDDADRPAGNDEIRRRTLGLYERMEFHDARGL